MSPPIQFKDWLPDHPDFGNPGLTEANNTIIVGGNYESYAPYAGSSTAFATTPSAGTTPSASLIAANLHSTVGPSAYVSVPFLGIFEMLLSDWSATTAPSWTNVAPSIIATVTSMAQYGQYVMATNGTDLPQVGTAGSTSTFGSLSSSTGTCPECYVLGVIGQFVFAGNLPNLAPPLNYGVQWSGINAPLSWPTPQSTTAVAQQSGQQALHLELGDVTGIYGGDQYGVILQQAGITRVTYVGGDVVFQFDTIYRGIGMQYRNQGIQVGNIVYFLDKTGIYATDGVSLSPIGEGVVNQWLIANIDATNAANARVGVDYAKKLIYWSFPAKGGTGTNSKWIAYNFDAKRFTHGDDSVLLYARGDEAAFATYGLLAFGTDMKLGNFTGTPGTATFETGESELNPGGYTYAGSVKGLVDVTAGAMTCALGTRNDLQATQTYTTDTTANSRSGFADFRVTARYMRARLKLTGTFNAAQGLELNAVPVGSV